MSSIFVKNGLSLLLRPQTGQKLNSCTKLLLSTEANDGDFNKSKFTPKSLKTNRIDYIESKRINHSQGWNLVNLALCPNASSPNNFYFNNKSGEFYCVKCKKTGDWNNLTDLIDKIEKNKTCDYVEDLDLGNPSESIEYDENINHIYEWKKSKPINTLNPYEFNILVKSSNLEYEFKNMLFELHDIRIANSKALFPVYDENKKLIQIISLNEPDGEYLNKNIVYGLNSLSLKSNKLFITDQVIDLLALQEVFRTPALVINSIDCLDFKMLALLERFDSIIFWQKDTKLSFSLSQILNSNRTYLMSHARQPYQSLIMKENLVKIVEREKFTVKNSPIIQFKDLKDNVYSEVVFSKKYTGIQWKRFPQLNEILKGHREGELTIITGATGSGKTTFLSEYSLDLSIQGVKTLWGSFEIQNHRLAKMMMTQYSGLNLHKNVSFFDFVSNEFSKLPIYFMNFHGEETLENVLKTMSNSVVLHDIKHIIIDNLQFMVGCQFNGKFDRFALQDNIISSFRKFATNFNCHVTIVIHPKKEDSDDLLKISSVFGSAKATQEADNILILQTKIRAEGNKKSKYKYIQISKNRFDGELGNIMLKFDKEKLSFTSSYMDGTTRKFNKGLEVNQMDDSSLLENELNNDEDETSHGDESDK